MFFCFLLFYSFGGTAQNYWGIQVSGVTTQISGDGYKGFKKFGFEGGLSFIKPLKKEGRFWGLELNYIQKGALERQKISEGNYNTFKYRGDYLELPVYYLLPLWGIYIQGGVSISYALTTEVSTNGILSPPLTGQNWLEVGFISGVMFEINDHLNFSVRYYNSLSPVQKSNNTAVFYWFRQGGMHSIIAMRLQFFFEGVPFKWVSAPTKEEQTESVE